MGNEQQSRNANGKQKANSKKRKQRNKIILIVVELIVLAILAVVLYGISKLEKIERPDNQAMEQVEKNEDIEEEVLEVMNQFRTIAVFGLDNRSNGNLDSGNSDVIIVVSIDNETQEVKMCSVFRDTYLDIGGGKFRKCNAAFSKGGPQAAISMLNKNLDLNITDYVTVDFNAVVECIDLLGGIDIELTEAEAEYLNEDDFWVYQDVQPGMAHLDGMTALCYARMRKAKGDSDSDIIRTSRQRKVILTIIEKLKTLSIPEIQAIVNEVLPMVITSMDNREITDMVLKLLPILPELSIDPNGTCPVNHWGEMVDIYSDGMYHSVLRFDPYETKRNMRQITEGEIPE